MTAVLFDLGGTNLRCATMGADRSLSNFRKERIESFLDGHQPGVVWEKILAQMSSYFDSVRNWTTNESPIVLAFPGPIDQQRIVRAPTITGGEVTIPDLRSELMIRTGRQVHILNDISAAAWYLSEKLTIDRFMVVTVSSGIGSKVFDRQHPSRVLDSQPYAGEIGHIVVDDRPNAPKCDCGGTGHVGAIASGRGIERAARSSARRDRDKFANSACAQTFGASVAHLNNEEHLVPAAGMGDEWALSVIRESTKPLATVLNVACFCAGLDRIVIIGGFALALGSVYLNVLRELMRQASDFEVLNERLPDMIQMGDMNEEACLMGAAAYADRAQRGIE